MDKTCETCSAASGPVSQGRNKGALWCHVRSMTRGPKWTCNSWADPERIDPRYREPLSFVIDPRFCEPFSFEQKSSDGVFVSGSLCNTRTLSHG
jgi:hypothetical protein